MKQRITSRIIASLIALVTIFTMLPLQSFALPAAPPVDAFAGAGGGGTGSGGSAGSGIWQKERQGFRITVLDYAGEPAFTFNGKDHLDLVYTKDRLYTMDYYCGGNKTSYANKKFHYKDPDAMNTEIITMAEFTDKMSRGIWDSTVPKKAGESEAAWSARCWDLKTKVASMLPRPIKTDGGYAGQGKKIREQLYGTGEKITDDALLYILLNLQYSREKDQPGIWLWQPKAGAVLGESKFTAEELGWYKTGLKDGQRYFPTDLMSSKNLVISVEPIVWNKLRLTYTKGSESTDQYDKGVYGTQSSIANCTSFLVSKGWFRPQSWAREIAGCDTAIFGNVGRKAMTTDNVGFEFSAYKDVSGKIVNEAWSIIKPPAREGKADYVKDDEVRTSDIGWGVQLYQLFGSTAPPPTGTSTCDEPNVPTPHQAPDPKDKTKVPAPQPGEDISKTRVYNIVKTYQEDKGEGAGMEHVTTNSRQNNPAQILIENEDKYVVKEWFISSTYNNPTGATTWENNKSQAPTTGDKGNSAGNTVKLKEPDSTLYVLLQRKIPVVVAKGDLIIRESQVTKAVETLTTKASNWGPKTMTFSAGPLSGSCEYVYPCTSKKCNADHTCRSPYFLDDVDWDYNHKNNTSIQPEIHANIGNFKPINAKGADATGTRGTLGTYNNTVDSFNYQLVVWRGQDIPTIANYKEPSSNILNGVVNRYGKQPAGNRYSSGNKAYDNNLLITLAQNSSLGDYRTSSRTDHGYTKEATHSATNTLSYDTVVKVEVYYGKAHAKGNLTLPGTQPIQTTLVGKSVPKYSGGQMKQSGEITWYPYIRMTYQTTTQAENVRTNVNILSQYISELTPNDYVEAAWISNKDFNMNIRSAQWSLHSRATSGDKGWNHANRVLPGGALYSLDTKNNKTYASIVSWQPYLEEEVRNKVVFKGTEYTYAATKGPHDAFVAEATKALEAWRVVQYVENHDSSGKTADIKKNTDSTLVLDGVKIAGGGQSLSGLTGLTGKSNTEDKYYMKPASTKEAANEGDIDILSVTTTEIKYKVTADVEGKIHVYRDRENSGWVEIATLNKNQDASALTGEVLALDQRTKVITNLCTVLTRNSGNDNSASWSKADGKWYNEAFDGICYTRVETCFELGYKAPNVRTAALDPALCPPNSGQSDLFSKAFLSQFFTNNKSDAYLDKADGFIGAFKGIDVILPGHKEMFKSMPFSIPNVNVQDLN